MTIPVAVFLGSIAIVILFRNLTTPSRGERLLWGPVNVVMLLTSILIAVIV